MPTISEATASYKRMTARKKVKDLAIRQSFMTYLNDWNINPHYRQLRNEQKMRMLRAEGKVCNSFCCLLHCYLITRCPKSSSLNNNILNMPFGQGRDVVENSHLCFPWRQLGRFHWHSKTHFQESSMPWLEASWVLQSAQ